MDVRVLSIGTGSILLAVTQLLTQRGVGLRADVIERSLAWFNADSRKTVDAERDALLDRIIARSA